MNNVLTALAVALVMISPARAAEIRLLSAAAMQTVFKELGPDFERASGHRLVIVYRTMGAITEQVLKGESADVVISSTLSMARLAREGRIEPAVASFIAFLKGPAAAAAIKSRGMQPN
jgi:molybdate transport system substrate-binding protein